MNGSNSPQQISDLIANCLICFWPTMQSLRVDNDDDEASHSQRAHNDCFVAVSSPSQLIEPNSWHHHASSSSFPSDRITNNSSDVVETDEQVTSSLPTRLHISIPPPNNQLLNIEEAETNTNVRHQRPPRRLTTVTVQSQNNNTEEQHCNDNGGNTLTSNTQNTLHRRTDDISLGFFTAQTLDEIHVTTTSNDDVVGDNNTPRSRNVDNLDNQQQYNDNVHNNNNHHRAFQTPGCNRARLDSDSFRQTIKVVTCEKRRISDESDVSPIDSDAGFSPIMLDSRHRRVAASENLSPVHDGDVNSSQKRLLFDDGGDSFDDHHQQQQLSPLSEFGLSVMKSLQSIIQSGGVSSNIGSPSNDKENKVPRRRKQVSSSPSSQTNHELPPWNDTFLPKSSTFLKALRRSGRRGKVLIQGWVAFRCQSDISWEDIIHNPKRCDFRYIILLDDMPILHMFTSRPRKARQNKKDKPDLFKDCLSIDLSGDDDVAVKINHVSKELGNEVCIFNQDDTTNEHDDTYSYSLLPISIPQNVFLDKHQSRLAKGGVLERVFEPNLVVNEGRRVSLLDCDDDGLLMLEKSSNNGANIGQRTTTEQYDVARHLLFVIDATIFKSQ